MTTMLFITLYDVIAAVIFSADATQLSSELSLPLGVKNNSAWHVEKRSKRYPGSSSE